MQAVRRLVLVLAAAAALPAAGWIVPAGGQESAAVTRLIQEVDTLRYRLDLETGQLRREVEQLRDRLRELDQRQRQAGLGGVAPAPPASSGGAPGAPFPGDEIVTRRLVIQDAAGRIRATVAVSDAFGPMLALLDEAGEVRLMASQPAAGPRLQLFDAQGTPRAALQLEDSPRQ